jgi:acyl carrier protein
MDDSELLACGLDSLGTMELRHILSQTFGVDLAPSFLSVHPTLGELVSFIEADRATVPPSRKLPGGQSSQAIT